MATEKIEQHGIEMMELLLTKGGGIDSSGEEILNLTASGGDVSLVQLLLDKNINPTLQMSMGGLQQ